jgi:DNA helicase-2/ATP-dependent DNA helicase PcrA
VYTDAGRREGLDVRAAYVHDLAASDRLTVNVEEQVVIQAEDNVIKLVDRLRDRDFGAAPEALKCGRCDVRSMCDKAI